MTLVDDDGAEVIGRVKGGQEVPRAIFGIGRLSPLEALHYLRKINEERFMNSNDSSYGRNELKCRAP